MGDRANLRTWLVVSIFLLGIVAGQVSADPNLVGHWNFDDDDANDSSGNDHHGTLMGSVTIVEDANIIGAGNKVAYFPGDTSSFINCGGGGGGGTWADFAGDTMTIAAWFRTDGAFYASYQYVCAKENMWRISRYSDSENIRFFNTGLAGGSTGNLIGTIKADDGQWHHVAGVYNGTNRYLYFDGEPDNSDSRTGNLTETTWDVYIGGNGSNPERTWRGWIDDVRLYNRGLSPSEITGLVRINPNKAWFPYPEDGQEDISESSLTLTWRPGDNAAAIQGHKVYLGTDESLVDSNDASVFQATRDVNNWPTGYLGFSKTYYWKVNEVNGVSEWPGDIWEFKTKDAKATNPHPVDGAIYLPLEPVLSWSPGCSVADSNGHDVYLGTDYAAVADANHNSDEFLGNFDVNSCSPDCLKARITYYWVVDEVNGPNTWPGDVWSFTTGTEGYYCNLFMDGGVNLTSRTTLPAAALLGLSMEYIAIPATDPIEDRIAEQNKIMVETDDGDWQDDNGVLLYPDGEPRFQCFYSNGGQSIDHGATLGEDGRQRIRDFYANGGSYTGSCAGSALPTIRVTSTGDPSYREEYYHIWPARGHYTQLAASYTGHDVPIDSPLLDYYDFGGDYYIASVRHNGGNYTIEDDSFYWCTGTEVLTTFAEPIVGDDTSYQPFMGHVSSWAYKEDANSGRLCPCGSHPESIESGERRDMMAAFLQYAMAGNGDPTVKAALENGVTRLMNDNSNAGHEKVGDKQYHHFTVQIPSGMKLTITLDGLDDVNDLNLFARKDDFALRGETEVYEADNTSNSDETLTINDPCAGTWYIGVKGAKTVTKTKETNYYRYTGNLGLLNGVAYTITAEWHMLGDFEPDDDVDSVDFSVLALSWQKAQGQAGYDPDCDISIPADDIIDEKDIKIFTDYWLAGK